MTRYLIALLSVLGATEALAQGTARPTANGERLFIQKGCVGCHGVSGHGGAGPDLAGTALPFEAFLKQVRTPRAQMPPFPPEAVSESEAQAITAS